MPKSWQAYQEEAARFFRSLGFDANVEAPVQGARAKHKVDVLVEFEHAGVRTRWVVECKYWKTAVSKEKVLALQAITQDVGADRAFLLSEKGFQSGAIAVARHTNVTLTNLQDLQENANDFVLQAKLADVARRYAAVNEPVSHFLTDEDGRPSSPPGTNFEDVLEIAADLFMLRIGLPQAIAGHFPITLASRSAHVEGEHVRVGDVAEFVSRAQEILDSAEQRIAVQRQLAEAAAKTIALLAAEFDAAVRELLERGEVALIQSPNSDQARMEALAAMRRTGAAADALRDVADKRVRGGVRRVMQFLIASVYVYLSQPTVSPGQWLQVCGQLVAYLDELEYAVASHDRMSVPRD